VLHPPAGVPSPCGGGLGFLLEVSIMSIITCDTPRSALDETAWRAVCKTAAEHAQRGCGLSWDHWVTLFSSEIDAQASRLPESQRVHALEIATQEWDYATPAERQETQDWLAENGCCSHGITLGCCPAGCGS
ncbi:hypothetical protein, partial [Priestia megaterium]|uniref:hypothetical protein n=1 Tax=Priestia megaterium TaxID=1404 RepID=UPI0020414BDB